MECWHRTVRFVTNFKGEVVDTRIITVVQLVRDGRKAVEKEVQIPLDRVCSPGVPEYPQELRSVLFPSCRDVKGWADPEMQRLVKLWDDYCSALMKMQSRWREATKFYGDIQLAGKTTY